MALSREAKGRAMKVFILFWTLANGSAGSQAGFNEAGCAAAAARLQASIEAITPGRREKFSGGVYKGLPVMSERIIYGEAWCAPSNIQ